MLHHVNVLDATAVKESIQMKDVRDPYWRWPTHEKWFSRLEGEWKTRETTSSADSENLQDELNCPFEVTTLISEEMDDFPEVTVKLHSPYLISILRKCLRSMVETLCCDEPSIDVRDLLHILPALKDEFKTVQGGNSVDGTVESEDHGSYTENRTLQGGNNDSDGSNGNVINGMEKVPNGGDQALDFARLHLQHFLRFLDKHFKDIIAKFAWMKEESVVSYKMLWAFLTPGLEVRRLCELSSQPCHAVIHSKGKYEDCPWSPEDNGFKIKLQVMEYDGESYRNCTMMYKIEEFDGEVPFTSLKVCPWYVLSSQEREEMATHLQERGQLYYSYAMAEPFRFMHYFGSLGFYERNSQGCFQLRRVNADGRVMVDLLSLARANPDWPLGNAQPPSELLRGFERREMEVAKQKKPSEEELKWAPAVIFGFSFSLKKWGCFDVGGLRQISFDDHAFDQLVMKSPKQKEMLRAIVTTHLSDRGGKCRGVDVVAEKGEGCVVLCYGPPGTGKTLTAETLAETLHRPLWAISAFELGEDAGELETRLRQVLSTALKWRAVVLLDEADCYLERRAYNVDITRNLMTGVFLRLLEYYAGVLFLTTNRVRAFDEAFLSRISLCISYPSLDDLQRTLIWQTVLARAGLAHSANEANVAALVNCGHPLNGREIRNIVSLANTWAYSRTQPLSLTDVHDALQLVIAGSKELLKDLETDL